MPQPKASNPFLSDLDIQSPEKQSAGFGKAYSEANKGSGLTGMQAQGLDQELRQSAARSPMANMMGAAMAMAESGVLRGQMAQQLLSKDQSQRNQALMSFAQMNPAGFVDRMREAGIDPDVSSQFLGATGANQSQVQRHGLGNVVRAQQRAEVSGMMAEEMGGAFMPSLKKAGYGLNERRNMSMQAGAAMQQEMERMAKEQPQLLSDPTQAAKRDEVLARAAQRALPGMDPNQVRQLTSGAAKAMEERVQSDPNLQKFKDVAGLLGMNNPNTIAAGVKRAQQMQEDEDNFVGPRDERGGGQRQPGDGQANTPNQRPIKITGSLTIRADGSAVIDAEGGLPVNE